MKVVFSVVLLAAVVFAVATPLFFGHALVEGSSKWFGASAGTLVIAAVLFLVVKRIAPNDPVPHHH